MPSFIGVPELIVLVVMVGFCFALIAFAVRTGIVLARRTTPRGCSHCGDAMRAGANFCGHCGAALTA